MPPKGFKQSEFTLSDRKAAFCCLLLLVEDGEVKAKNVSVVSKKLGVARRRLKRLWAATISNMQAHLSNQDGTPPFHIKDLGTTIPLAAFPGSVFQSHKVGAVDGKQKFT